MWSDFSVELTSAELWVCERLTPGERSRRLCRSSSHRRPLSWQHKTGGLNPDTEKWPRLFYTPHTSPPKPTPLKLPTLYLAPGVSAGKSAEMSSLRETRRPTSICRKNTTSLPGNTEQKRGLMQGGGHVTYLHISTRSGWKRKCGLANLCVTELSRIILFPHFPKSGCLRKSSSSWVLLAVGKQHGVRIIATCWLGGWISLFTEVRARAAFKGPVHQFDKFCTVFRSTFVYTG